MEIFGKFVEAMIYKGGLVATGVASFYLANQEIFPSYIVPVSYGITALGIVGVLKYLEEPDEESARAKRMAEFRKLKPQLERHIEEAYKNRLETEVFLQLRDIADRFEEFIIRELQNRDIAEPEAEEELQLPTSSDDEVEYEECAYFEPSTSNVDFDYEAQDECVELQHSAIKAATVGDVAQDEHIEQQSTSIAAIDCNVSIVKEKCVDLKLSTSKVVINYEVQDQCVELQHSAIKAATVGDVAQDEHIEQQSTSIAGIDCNVSIAQEKCVDLKLSTNKVVIDYEAQDECVELQTFAIKAATVSDVAQNERIEQQSTSIVATDCNVSVQQEKCVDLKLSTSKVTNVDVAQGERIQLRESSTKCLKVKDVVLQTEQPECEAEVEEAEDAVLGLEQEEMLAAKQIEARQQDEDSTGTECSEETFQTASIDSDPSE